MRKVALALPLMILAAPVMACAFHDSWPEAQANAIQQSQADQQRRDAATLRSCMACEAAYGTAPHSRYDCLNECN
jgi:cytochrome c553